MIIIENLSWWIHWLKCIKKISLKSSSKYIVNCKFCNFIPQVCCNRNRWTSAEALNCPRKILWKPDLDGHKYLAYSFCVMASVGKYYSISRFDIRWWNVRKILHAKWKVFTVLTWRNCVLVRNCAKRSKIWNFLTNETRFDVESYENVMRKHYLH